MRESIAIIGMSCRFPGAPDADAFWDLLINARSPLQEIPAARWDVDQYYSTDETVLGKMYVRQGYFIEGMDQFDPQFFRISPKEALTLDPQHRLLLEVSCEAFASANIASVDLLNSNTGVFVGLMNHDYWHLLTRHAQVDETSFLAGMGNSSHCAAGRIAYTFGLQGPCATLDTACSSSLVALHQACQALLNDECTIAVVGAANAILDPNLMVSMCNGKVLARDGRCKSFDANADGYGRGEGCGVVVLKRLSAAQQNNDRVLAIIRGTAVNQNGSGNGLTVPNGEAQRALLQKALQAAALSAHEIDYLEAHGSATQLGDLIEMNSIAAVMGNDPERHSPLYISSVKPNIGHLESASGMAGLIKVILSLQHQQLPKHLHLSQLNPHFNLSALQAIIPQQIIPWTKNARPRIAGVSSFGISGTNAHAIISEAEQSSTTEFAVAVPFQRKRYWMDTLRKRFTNAKQHAFMQQNDKLRIDEVSYTKLLNVSDVDYLADHKVNGELIFPAAGFIELALATIQTQQNNTITLENIQIEQPLILSAAVDVSLQINMRHAQANTFNLVMSSDHKRHVSMSAAIETNSNNEIQDLTLLQSRCKEQIDVVKQYEQLAELGLQYGSRMQAVQTIWRGYNEAIAKLSLPTLSRSEHYYAHPVLLDGAFQALAMNIYLNQRIQGEPQFYLPLGMQRIVYHAAMGSDVYVHLRYRNTDVTLDIIEADLSIYDETGRMLLDVASFYLKRAQPIKDNVDQVFYAEQWQAVALNQSPAIKSKVWLLIGNATDLTAKLQQQLSDRGINAHLISSSDEIRDADAQAEVIVYLEGLNTECGKTTSINLLHTLQVLQQLEKMPDVYVLTQGARRVSNETRVNLQQAMLWGLLQCARHELTRGKLHVIDLDPRSNDSAAHALDVVNAVHGTDETQIAFRDQTSYGVRLVRMPHPQALITPHTFQGTYLVTGGLGGLGFATAEWLAQQQVRHIALVSRQQPTQAVQQRIEALRLRGINIKTFTADVSDKAQLQQVLDTIRLPDSGFAPLRGVVHAAGILSDGMIATQTQEKYQRVFQAKVDGATHLHELTQQDNLDDFILFSSIAAITGAPGQTNYGAANAFMDALAQQRHLQGLPAFSINWGPWAEVGMARDWVDAHANRGVSALSPARGVHLLSLALQFPATYQLMIADIHWQQFVTQIPLRSQAYYAQLVSSDMQSPQVMKKSQVNWHDQVSAALKSILGFAIDDELNGDDNFFNLGMDSLLAMQFSEALKVNLPGQIELPMVAIFQHPTLNSLISHMQTLPADH